MNLSAFRTELFCYLVILPAAILCYLPVKKHLHFSFRRTLTGTAVILALSVPCLALADAALSPAYNAILVPALIVFLFLYHRTLKIPFFQSLAVFVLVCTFFSFLSNFANGFDAWRNPQGSLDSFSYEAAVFQLVLCIVFTVTAAYPFHKFGGWLIDHLHIRSVWYITCLVSGIFLTLNFLMLPRKYETLHTNNVALYYYTALPLLMLLLIILCIIFYIIVKGLLEMAETKERNHILEIEEEQYRKAMYYMKESANTRHDFRHTIVTLDEILKTENISAAREYLANYQSTLPKNEVVLYCGHTPLNALLNYYAQLAHHYAVRLRITVELPGRLPLSDIDLCNIVGNMFDNAIIACKDIPEAQRRIDLTISCLNDVRFGIIQLNSFNGKVKLNKKRYLSTHHAGNGMGLSSIASTVERYGGTAVFHHDGIKFISSVLIPIKK